MNREIKVRAWDIKQKVMCEVRAIDFDQGTAFISWMEDGKRISNGQMKFDGKNPDIILMQYTGLKDKSGFFLDWWEGDLLDCYGQVGSIIFEEGAFWFSPIETPDEWEYLHLLADDPIVKKLGTIHDNPELLESGK